MEKLNLEPDRPPWSIYFCEDVVAAVSTGTPLLDAGVVLRARKRPGRDDATIKLRPCRRSQLTNHWLRAKEGDGWEFKVEADWAGPRRVLAASLTANRSRRVIAAVGAGDRSEALLNEVVKNLVCLAVLAGIRSEAQGL